MKKKRESLTNQNQSIISSSSKLSSHSATSLYSKTDKYDDSKSNIKSQFKYFFDLRGYLLQWHFLNAETQQKIRLQTSKQEVTFLTNWIVTAYFKNFLERIF